MQSVLKLKATLKNKRIVVLGLGLTGMSFVRFLTANDLHFSVNDSRTNLPQFDDFAQKYGNVSLITGGWDKTLIAQADLLLVSPGVDITQPELSKHIAEHCLVWGDVELYARIVPSNTSIVAVTGSNGKSTVVSLLAHIGQALGKNTQLGGNIGVPVLDTIDFNEPHWAPDFLILELSSFQLETLSSLKAKACCILNISDDHLDRHLTMERYTALKQHIYTFAELAVFNRDDKLTTPQVQKHQKCISFGVDQPVDNQFGLIREQQNIYLCQGKQTLISTAELPIAGIHNAANCLAALALGQKLNWPLAGMLAAIKTFKGLAHRFEIVKSDDGIQWINDSKATNIGATLAAIESLSATLLPTQKMMLIAGGDGKGADFSVLKPVIDKQVSRLITLGKDADKLMALTDNGIQVNSLEQAVDIASQFAEKGDVVLLSPACASIDMFANFAERGQAFINAVQSVREAS